MAAPALRRLLLGLVCAAAPMRIGAAGPDDGGVAAGHAADSSTPNGTLVSMLLRPEDRDHAVCELLRRQRYEYTTDPGFAHCRVNAVVVAPQGREAPIFVVFLAETWSRDFAGPGVPKGHFVLIDSSGALLPVFWNANVLGRDADIVRYRGDERLALALVVPVDDGRHMSTGLQTLHIVPVERSPRSILSVIVGPPGRSVPSGEVHEVGESKCLGDVCVGQAIAQEMKSVFPWAWRQVIAGDLPPKVELGPTSALARDRPAATFRWSPAKQRYEGPFGSRARGFLRFDDRLESWPDAVFSFTGRRPK